MEECMNRIFISLFISCLLFGTLSANAVPSGVSDKDDAALSRIEKAGEKVTDIRCDFTRTRTLKASGKVIKSEGELFFNSKGCLAMLYVKPAEEFLILNPGKVYMKRSGKGLSFSTDKNKQMDALSTTLIGCIEGKVGKVAEENSASVAVEDRSGEVVVVLTSKVQGVKGYSKIVLSYRKSDYMLTKMSMLEFSGVENLYDMSQIQKNISVDESVFNIPEK